MQEDLRKTSRWTKTEEVNNVLSFLPPYSSPPTAHDYSPLLLFGKNGDRKQPHLGLALKSWGLAGTWRRGGKCIDISQLLTPPWHLVPTTFMAAYQRVSYYSSYVQCNHWKQQGKNIISYTFYSLNISKSQSIGNKDDKVNYIYLR